MVSPAPQQSLNFWVNTEDQDLDAGSILLSVESLWIHLDRHLVAADRPIFGPNGGREAISPTRKNLRQNALLVSLVLLVVGVCWPAPALAYVGPGAGFAFLASAMALVITVIALVFGVLLWPFRLLYRLITWKRPPRKKRIHRAVIVGLDGLDPERVRRLMSQGRLPNLERLKHSGSFSELDTTFPAMSPVAWSSFSTGSKPCKHGIFDFLDRDPATYLPVLSSAHIAPPSRHLKLGPLKIPLAKPQVRFLRKSQSFWKILGGYRIPSSILRVPITFPPEKFGGTLLSAMCTPDLLGTQGTYTLFTDEPGELNGPEEGGRTRRLKKVGAVLSGTLEGPTHPMKTEALSLELPFKLRLAGKKNHVEKKEKNDAREISLEVGTERLELKVGAYTPWVKLEFPLVPGMKVRGACRFRLLETKPYVRLYVTPINLHPENPAMPISHPSYFSVFLSKLNGPFATLGLAEDTSARNEEVLDDRAFLEQAADIHEEREKMFFEMVKRTPKGLVACVFDTTDRVQHMFMRQDTEGAQNEESEETEEPKDIERKGDAVSPVSSLHEAASHEAIDATYQRMDQMLGKLFDTVDIEDDKNLVMVLSDHGFKPFRRGVNLNAWLFENGYLALKEGRDGAKSWLGGVDWEKTKAYSMGLAGLFLNVKGRESQGVVAPGDEAEALRREIAEALSGLEDTDIAGSPTAINKAYPAQEIYSGPYASQAPDVIVGYAQGYRASWQGARGQVKGAVITENDKAWSGDHCMDPHEVPGVLFTNRALSQKGERPRIYDVAPTVLSLFGIPTPRFMDGVDLCPPGKEPSPNSAQPESS